MTAQSASAKETYVFFTTDYTNDTDFSFFTKTPHSKLQGVQGLGHLLQRA